MSGTTCPDPEANVDHLRHRDARLQVAALWFFDQGIGVFPIVTPGKTPACHSWDDYTCSRRQAAALRNYGVRLGRCRPGWLAVVDTDTHETELWVAKHLPKTPLVVTTAQGRHRYFRTCGPRPAFIRRDGLAIEFRNQGQYVVGPGSRHTSGVVYAASSWTWLWEDLPDFPEDFDFDDGSCGRRSAPHPSQRGEGYEFPDAVSRGERHAELFRLLRSFKGLGTDKATTREMISLANQTRCHPPLVEDHTFNRWFERGWNNPDRPFHAAPAIPPAIDETEPAVDLDHVELDGWV